MEFNQTVNIKTTIKSVMSDLFTPVGIYLRLRDKFRDTILLESAGNQNNDNNFSFIAINAVAGIEIRNYDEAEIKFPLGNPQKIALENKVATVNTNDIVQGKVAAVMSNEVEVLLNNAENMLQAISADTGLTSSNIAEKVLEIEAVLNAADLLISEI